MTNAPTRDAITTALFEEWDAITAVLSGLTEDEWSRPTALPGWTVHDAVAHLIGTESLLAGVNPPKIDIDVTALPHVKNDIAAFNERWVQGLRDYTPQQMIEGFQSITATRRAALTAMTDADFAAPALTPVGPDTYGRFMRIRIFDCWLHELDIRDAVGRPGDEGGIRAELAFGEVVGALGFVVGKQGKAPDAARIMIQLTGAAPRNIAIAVDGRAAVVPELDGPPTITLRLDSGLFARLVGGRVSPARHSAEIKVTGDVEAGQRIVDHLAFTI